MQSEINPHQTPPERLLRLPEVETRVGLRKSSIYEAIRRGAFPTPVRLSPRAVCWPASEIDAWISERIGTRARA
ncbi:AlpA family transcriptional regulator [Variovorax dokdonensis]|uniref:AlpA family transcriptional regulator n=2 Tax=Variovorax dokdonensis TaxID=344883 RepID=A0ABT7NG92_9BURK|nr:AlpA family transcriptional regulator [Variovorax dokdonensis]